MVFTAMVIKKPQRSDVLGLQYSKQKIHECITKYSQPFRRCKSNAEQVRNSRRTTGHRD